MNKSRGHLEKAKRMVEDDVKPARDTAEYPEQVAMARTIVKNCWEE